MTYNEFIVLSEGDQLIVVINSLAISVREQEGCTVLLHQVHDFYVEIYYNMEKTEVISIEAIESFPSLDPYWQQMSPPDSNKFINWKNLLV